MVNQPPSSDSSRPLLDLAHLLLSTPIAQPSDVSDLLRLVVEAADALGAGLIASSKPDVVFGYPSHAVSCDPTTYQNHLDRWNRLPCSSIAGSAHRPGSSPDLVARLNVGAARWFLWLEAKPGRTCWTQAEAAALSLISCSLSRLMETEPQQARWVHQLELTARKNRLEEAAGIARRLLRDFGNILTGIMGFTELALAQPLSSSGNLHTYLIEIYRAAQAGAEYTSQLRHFSCREAISSRECRVGDVLDDVHSLLFSSRNSNLLLRVDVSKELPSVAIDAVLLKLVLKALLDNSRESLIGSGVISVSARRVELTSADAVAFYGDVRPGSHVEIIVADTGCGLTPEVSQRLFQEPFFSTKKRRRGGFGLATAYGVLFANKGGLYLHPGEERGVVARVVLPVAPVSAMSGMETVNDTREDSLLVATTKELPHHFVIPTLTESRPLVSVAQEV